MLTVFFFFVPFFGSFCIFSVHFGFVFPYFCFCSSLLPSPFSSAMLRQLAIQMVIAGIVYWWMSDAVSFLLLFYFLSHIHNSISSHHYAQQIELLTEKITQLERKTKSRVSIPSKGKEREGREGREGGKEREGRGRKMPQRSISPSQNNEENVFGGSPAPELPIRVMDLASSSEKEVYPNWRAPTPILNDWFEVRIGKKRRERKEKKRKEMRDERKEKKRKEKKRKISFFIPLPLLTPKKNITTTLGRMSLKSENEPTR